jgi:4'-phosphopantetheinyl transferase
MMFNAISFADVSTLLKKEPLNWSKPPADTRIQSGEIHLWQMKLDIDDHWLDHLMTVLSSDERELASNFRFEVDKKRFAARRGALRIVLARYLGLRPGELQFRYTARGKPFLESSGDQASIRFSSSSSGSLWLLTVAHNQCIGIDTEDLLRPVEYEEIASDFFSPAEAKQILALSGITQATAFFFFWTAKEAYLKAVGLGLCSSLDKVWVPFQKQLFPSFIQLEGPMVASNVWSGLCFNPSPKHIATLIWEGQIINRI